MVWETQKINHEKVICGCIKWKAGTAGGWIKLIYWVVITMGGFPGLKTLGPFIVSLKDTQNMLLGILNYLRLYTSNRLKLLIKHLPDINPKFSLGVSSVRLA